MDASARTRAQLSDYGDTFCWLMAAVNTRFSIGLEQRAVERPRPGDDDGPFVRAGYAAAVVNIGSWPYADPNYHGEGDIPERCDVPNAAQAVQATLAALLTLDRASAVAKRSQVGVWLIFRQERAPF